MNRKYNTRIIKKKITKLSKWVTLVKKTVIYKKKKLNFHAFKVHDYIAILAKTTDGKFAIVKQYRPVHEKFLWELPGGIVDQKKPLKKIAIDEVKEETGLIVIKIKKLKSCYSDTGRLINKIHFYYADCRQPKKTYIEKGIKVKFVNYLELISMIKGGNFSYHLHLAAILLAKINNIKL